MDKHYKPVLLMILDGWGIREMEHGNAIKQANTPNYDRWNKIYERAVIDASGEPVGLVPGQMGNSEVGHMNLGAGRIVYQDITRINNAIRDRSLFEHPDLTHSLEQAKANGKKVHITGLLGSGGVHAIDQHLYALLELTAKHGIAPIVHVITDGRDTSPGSAMDFLKALEPKVEAANGVIASVSGRYYAMDRDKRWERSGKAFNAIANHHSDQTAPTLQAALQQSFDNDVMDEFVLPTIIETDQDVTISEGDMVICYNFRADRMRQLVKLLVDESIAKEAGVDFIPHLDVLTMTEYEDGLPVTVLFPVQVLDETLAQVLSQHSKKQFHIAETEKYPHVTFFFNGRREDPFEGEDRTIIPSPKDVATYDLKPQMSAYEVTETILERIHTHDDDFLLINFANPDMVGHTGVLEAAIKAAEVVDECAGRVVQAIVDKGGVAIVTADHGNSDRMIDEVTGKPHTYHTTSPVPLFAISTDYIGLQPRGKLGDVAPTVLELLGIPQPDAMTGTSLILFDL